MTDLVTWTDERVEQLKKEWDLGLSASQIARRIGGVSRSAVIGKVHRLGLSGRATISCMSAANQREANTRRAASFKAAMKRKENTRTNLPLPPPGKIPGNVIQNSHPDYLKSDHCRYHYGAVTDATGGFCEHASAPGIAYCTGHAVLCFAPAPPRRPSTFQEGPKTKDRTTVFGKVERTFA
jgi:GcrA cell cycle regulator